MALQQYNFEDKSVIGWDTVLRRVRRITKNDYELRHDRRSVRPFVRTHGTTRLPLDGFSWSLIFEDFSKICQEN